MTRPPLFERLRYAFDNTLTGGPLGLVTWLASFTAILILSLAFMVMLIGGAPSGTGFNDLLWMGFNQTLDPTSLDNTLPSAILFAMVFAAVGGLFITSTLVGIVTTEMQGRIEGLREGRSRVIERDHIVVLGWTPNVFTILAELVEANSNQARCCIVVLGEEDRTTMEHRVAERLGDTGSTRIVCRSGSAVDIDDLYIANIHAARSIIILTPTGEGSDVAVIKTLLAILNSKQRRPEPYHIVAALSDPSNAEVARLVAGDEAVIILSEDVIARIIAQTAGQPGLSLVYQDLLDFAEDDDTTHLRKGGAADIDTDAFRATNAVADPRWRVLMLGWNELGEQIARQLNRYVATGSILKIVTDDSVDDLAVLDLEGTLRRLAVSVDHGDPTRRSVIESAAEDVYDHAIILAAQGAGDIQEADGRTLVTLLHLRDITRGSENMLPIVTQMMDSRNRDLAASSSADDFVISDRLVSLLLSQIAENKDLYAVFRELFSADGSEIYIRPAPTYVEPDRPVTFYTVVASAIQRGEVAIGYRLASHAEDNTKNYGVTLNPRKGDQISLGEQDAVIVLAHD